MLKILLLLPDNRLLQMSLGSFPRTLYQTLILFWYVHKVDIIDCYIHPLRKFLHRSTALGISCKLKHILNIPSPFIDALPINVLISARGAALTSHIDLLGSYQLTTVTSASGMLSYTKYLSTTQSYHFYQLPNTYNWVASDTLDTPGTDYLKSRYSSGNPSSNLLRWGTISTGGVLSKDDTVTVSMESNVDGMAFHRFWFRNEVLFINIWKKRIALVDLDSFFRFECIILVDS